MGKNTNETHLEQDSDLPSFKVELQKYKDSHYTDT